MIVLIVNGVPDAGKNTFAETLSKLCNGNLVSYSSIDWVKEKAYELGWDGIKDKKGRQLLNDIKLATIAYADIPTRKVMEEIAKYLVDVAFMCVDVREPDEIRKLKRACASYDISCFTVLIENNVAEQKRQDDGIDNPADSNTHEIPYDIVMKNNGSKDEFQKITKTLFEALQAGKIETQDELLFNPAPPLETSPLCHSDYYQRAIADHYDTLPVPVLSAKSTHLLINALALCGEAGEIANMIKKIVWYRNGVITPEDTVQVSDEIGDNLYHSAQLATLLKRNISGIMDTSISKGQRRGSTGFIKGE